MQIGTYQISLVASALNTPVYCVAQSFKFTRLYPLSQKEIPEEKTDRLVLAESWKEYSLLKEKYPDLLVETSPLDYTPPNYLTLLFTDLGVLTPSAVSDELIKLYS
jgi:translation initiation factor eIF-2B subunit alpha